MSHHRVLPFVAAASVVICASLGAQARVKLITLPVRQKVVVQLGQAGSTFVQEQRIVPLNQGENDVDFSWDNTRIDPSTIVFRVLGPAEGAKGLKANVLSVSYPPGENALVWRVSANEAGSAMVRISYVLGGLDKRYSYRVVTSADEKTLTLEEKLLLANNANESYGNALIETGLGASFDRSIGLNETKEVTVHQYEDVPVEKTYTADVARFGYLDQGRHKLNVRMDYVLTNDKAHGLGEARLPFGKVRIFQKDKQGSQAFLGEDWGQRTPPGEKMRLYVGLAQDIVVKRTVDTNRRTKLADNMNDYHVVLKYVIENHKDKAVRVRIAEQINQLKNELHLKGSRPVSWKVGSKTDFKSGPVSDQTNQHRIMLETSVPARQGDKAGKVVKHLELIFERQL